MLVSGVIGSMKKTFYKTALILLLSFFTGVLFQFSIDSRPVSEQEFVFKSSPPPFLGGTKLWADSVFQTLSTEEKLGQLIMVAAYPEKGKNDIRRVTELIKKYKIGGIIFFNGKAEEVASLTKYYQSISKVPLLIGIDGEWGPSMRLSHTIVYPHQMMLGAIDDYDILYQMGRDIGKQLKMLGIHVNFAPVIDVNSNPDNPVISSRSFGENRENVARKGILYMRGLQDEGILAVAKHFPGHGDTDQDSHQELPIILHQVHRLDSIELYPFKALIESGVGGIMSGHLNVPALDTTYNLPSTLSFAITSKLLKEQMKFNGLVFTDAMTMKGITECYSPEEANIMAILAGNDILLMPDDIEITLARLEEMVKDSVPLSDDLNKRCSKILQAKAWAVLPQMKNKTLNEKQLLDSLNSPYFELVLRKLIEKSLTVVTNPNDLIPLKNLETLHIAAISVGDLAENNFQHTLSLYSTIDCYHISDDIDSLNVMKILDTLNCYNLILLSLHSNDLRVANQFGISNKLLRITDTLLTLPSTILTDFTNPYLLRKLKNLENNVGLIVAYENDSTIQSLAAQLLFGAIPANGKLPVSITKNYRVGKGVETESIQRLKYTLPLEAGFDDEALQKIDSLVQDAINKKAMPGCQILVARNGNVILEKSYGYQTYYKKNEVKNTDLYDLASLTKIVATVPSLMLLEESNKIDLREPVSTYLSELDTTNKAKIQIEDILLHQAGLRSWIPFYQSTIEPVYPDQKFSSYRYSRQYPIQIGTNIYVNKHLKYKQNCYSHSPNETFNIQIADGLYMNHGLIDSIFYWIYASDVSRPGKYVYSDLGFYLFYQMIERLTDQKLEFFVDSCFYAPLGASRLTFKPLQKFQIDEIAPTENDLVFRKQIIQGYVHDPGAAMLGGVSGHAGLFSNANDLAKYMQMLLNGGKYGGKEFLNKKLIEKYTSCMECRNGNRRGLGFDKPEIDPKKNGPTFTGISSESYGHTGFTGTMVWADPSTGILYIFLSNRVYPDAINNKLLELNLRTNIQKAVYDAMIR
jgi:beta-glucosidase-like glycosyl hydrolase/CubicO group peptidase (beta-lactamase class C family)